MNKYGWFETPDIRCHLVDLKTGKFLCYDRYGNDGLFLSGWGGPFVLCFDPNRKDDMEKVVVDWGRPVSMRVSMDGNLMKVEERD